MITFHYTHLAPAQQRMQSFVWICFFLCSFSAFLHAQTAVYNSMELNLDRVYLTKMKDFHLHGEGGSGLGRVTGSPYLSEDWMLSTIMTKDGDTVRAMVRYRTYGDIMEVRDPSDGGVYGLVPDLIDAIALGNRYFRSLWLLEDDKKKRGYLEELTAGHINLYAYHTAEFRSAFERKSMGHSVPAKFLAKKTYFVSDADGPADQIKLKKKDLLKVFGRKKRRMEKYADQEGLNFKKEADVVRMFAYYNTMINNASAPN